MVVMRRNLLNVSVSFISQCLVDASAFEDDY